MSSSRFTAINGPSPPQTLKLSDSGSNLRLSQMGPPLQPPRELNTCLPNPTKRKRSSHNEVEKDDEEKDDTTLFAAAPKRYASASSAGVNVAYQPVPLLRGEVEAVGASRNDHHNDGPQLSEQVDRSKRKKTFSPRTKTGCGTCRKRKKKCDEAKPTCINCFKSGFTCAGYAPQPGCENPGPPASYAENRGILPKQLYSPFYDEPRVQPGPFIAAPRLPPLPQLILLQPAATAQPAFQHQPRHQPPPLPRAPSLQQESEKLKMLAGRPFNPAAPELRALREECKYALSRFSQAAGVGAGIEEQMQRFWEILRLPPPSRTRNPERVMVDQPFNCDYGFNLKIGNDVSIGKDCMVEDAAEVVIGDGCKLGPCVTISTMEWGRWTQDGDGERLATAKMVRLESNVVVGAGARILPGSHIPSGTVVAPGEIVPRRS